jgi:hypothetical protein
MSPDIENMSLARLDATTNEIADNLALLRGEIQTDQARTTLETIIGRLQAMGRDPDDPLGRSEA